MKRAIFVKANGHYIPQYAAITTIYRDDSTGEREVIKSPMTPTAIPHLRDMAEGQQMLADVFPSLSVCPCAMEGDNLRLNYIDGKDWQTVLQEAAERSDAEYIQTWQQFLSLLQPKKDCITPFASSSAYERLFGDGDSLVGCEAVSGCAFDMTPSNVILREDGVSVVIDYEWVIHAPIPLPLLHYHAVATTCRNHPVLNQKVPLEQLLQQLHLQQAEACEKALRHFLCHIMGDMSWPPQPLYLQYAKACVSLKEIANVGLLGITNQQAYELSNFRARLNEQKALNKELSEANTALAESLSGIKIHENWLQSELSRTQNELVQTWNSRSWKITAPIRFLNRVRAEGRNPVRAVLGKLYHRVMPSKPPRQIVNWLPEITEKYTPAGSVALGEHPRRLTIFFFFDRDGVVDGYVPVLLRSLKQQSERLLVVASGKLTEDGRRLLEANSDELLCRENSGFDAWSYKAALQHIGWKQLGDYDEVLLTNHTIMGPVRPVDEMFAAMASREVDFWGISVHPGMANDPFQCCPYHCLPEHIQSWFLVFRKPMVTHPIFRSFWEKLPMIHDYNEAVGLFEAVLTRYFSEAGFRWDTFLNRFAYYPMTDNPMITIPVEVIRDMNCPFFKRRAFFQDYDYLVTYTCAQPAMQLEEYLREHTDYDMDLLWDNLLRTCHMNILQEDLHLTRILPVERRCAETSTLRVAQYLHLYDVSMCGELMTYLQSLPERVDIFISTTSQERAEQIRDAFRQLPNHMDIRVFPNRGRDVSGLLAGFARDLMAYDVICVTHDKRTSHLRPGTVGEGFAYTGYRNILASKTFVENVLSTFDREKRLGLLVAPPPNHADFATQIGLEWGKNFDSVKNLAVRLSLHVPMDEDHYPIAPYGSSFWVRTDALRPLLEHSWTYEDFPEEPLSDMDGTLLQAVERIYPYCAQDRGYYTALLMTEDYSALELGNLQFYAQQYAKLCDEHHILNNFIGMRSALDNRMR